jgi:hypothetical protein
MVRLGGRDRNAPTAKSTEDRDAYSILEFCRRHGISHGTYYNLKKSGLGPREAHVLRRILISKEAAADWRRAREGEATFSRRRNTHRRHAPLVVRYPNTKDLSK